MTTAGSDAEAEALAEGLVGTRLAACVQLSRIVSYYVWEGEATRSDEVLLLIKSQATKVPEITEYLGRHHSYETPEVVEVPITSGLPAYLGWIDQSVS